MTLLNDESEEKKTQQKYILYGERFSFCGCRLRLSHRLDNIGNALVCCIE